MTESEWVRERLSSYDNKSIKMKVCRSKNCDWRARLTSVAFYVSLLSIQLIFVLSVTFPLFFFFELLKYPTALVTPKNQNDAVSSTTTTIMHNEWKKKKEFTFISIFRASKSCFVVIFILSPKKKKRGPRTHHSNEVNQKKIHRLSHVASNMQQTRARFA